MSDEKKCPACGGDEFDARPGNAKRCCNCGWTVGTCPDCGTRMGKTPRCEHAEVESLERSVLGLGALHDEYRAEIANLTRERDEARAACAAIMGDVPRLLEALEHDKPGDCYATGPLHGDIRDQMCVACDAQMILNNWLAGKKG